VLTLGFFQVRFLAWLEYKLSQGYEITEFEAASRLTEYRRMNKYYMGLAYENISASGSNGGENFVFYVYVRTLTVVCVYSLTTLFAN
jgi:hypothetical protein